MEMRYSCFTILLSVIFSFSINLQAATCDNSVVYQKCLSDGAAHCLATAAAVGGTGTPLQFPIGTYTYPDGSTASNVQLNCLIEGTRDGVPFGYYTGGGVCSFGTFPCPIPPDLAVVPPIFVSPGTFGSDGLLTVQPGIMVRIAVPITVLSSGSYGSVPITTKIRLQVGSRAPIDRQISIFGAVNNRQTINFSVTFLPSDIGVQSVTATLDPDNLLQDPNVNNNSATRNIRVGGQPQYKLSIITTKEEVAPDKVGLDNMAVVTASLSSTNSSPIGGKLLLFSVTPEELSGGHLHTGNRPRGILNAISCITDSAGFCTVPITYKASEVSGVDTISVQLSGSPSVTNSKTIDVKVPGLIPMSGGPYSLKCSIEDCSTYNHDNFYSVLPFVDVNMSVIGVAYRAAFPTADPFVVTDASLEWGGQYDYNDTWAMPHLYHRIGTDIDVRGRSIPDDNRRKFKNIVCKLGGFPKLEKKGKPNEHFHIYFSAYNSKIFTYCQNDPGE